MERIDKTVFLSYRRTNFPWALAIFQSLTHSGFDVFFDYDGIASGDFESVILGNITARAHFLVLLTPSALERCGEPEDWLRREIETALQSQRNIVPLMLEGFDFGTPTISSQLTGQMSALKHYNGLSIPPQYFFDAMTKLRDKYLNVPLRAVLHPGSVFAQLAATREKTAATEAPEVLEDELMAQQWFERGFAAIDLDEKVRFYTGAIRLNPDYAGAFYNRGYARSEKGDAEGALQDYTEAIRLEPDDASAFYNRGIVRVEKGDVMGAIKDYTEAIRRKPNLAFAYCRRGDALSVVGDAEGALRDYADAIRLDPDNAMPFLKRGIVRSALGDPDGAAQDYTEAIRLKPGDPDAFHGRGIVRCNEGDFDGALRDLTEAIRLRPEYASAFQSRGIARSAKGDKDGAQHDYAEAIRLGHKPKK